MPPAAYSESFSLTLGPESSANASAVASTLQALIVLVEETEREVASTDQVAIRIRPFEKGSLQIPFDLIFVSALTLFEYHPQLTRILSTIKQYIEIKKLLKGQPVEERFAAGEPVIGNITVNGNNNVINILQNPRVAAVIDQAFTEVTKDEEINEVRFVNETTKEEIATISRKEFPYFRYADKEIVDEQLSDRVRGVRTTLTIRSPVFEGRAKWKLTYNGRTIAADIRDQSFLARVSARIERFAAGDRLEVDLEIGEKFNEAISDYEETSQFAVVKVHQHTQPPASPQQKDLFTDAD